MVRAFKLLSRCWWLGADNFTRDTEDSAPAEFPPEQPEADTVEDDGVNYGAEEEDDEEEVEEVEEEPKAVEGTRPDGEDEEMAGADETAGPLDPSAPKVEGDAEESDAGSEDLEAESSGSEEEEIEEEGEGDEDLEMAEDGDQAAGTNAKEQPPEKTPQGEVMVH